MKVVRINKHLHELWTWLEDMTKSLTCSNNIRSVTTVETTHAYGKLLGLDPGQSAILNLTTCTVTIKVPEHE